jgi:hypothetical protein
MKNILIMNLLLKIFVFIGGLLSLVGCFVIYTFFPHYSYKFYNSIILDILGFTNYINLSLA